MLSRLERMACSELCLPQPTLLFIDSGHQTCPDLHKRQRISYFQQPRQIFNSDVCMQVCNNAGRLGCGIAVKKKQAVAIDLLQPLILRQLWTAWPCHRFESPPEIPIVYFYASPRWVGFPYQGQLRVTHLERRNPTHEESISGEADGYSNSRPNEVFRSPGQPVIRLCLNLACHLRK